MNKQKTIINILSENNNELLDKSKSKKIDHDKEINWLTKKVLAAGFTSIYATNIFILLSISFGLLSGIFALIVIKSPIAFIIIFIIFSFFPLIFLKKIIESREEEFNFGLKAIIDKTTSMMKSGVGFEQALKKSVLTSRSKLTQDIFNIYITEKDVIGEKKAFEKMFKLIESKELRIFYLVISIGKQSGGKFSNTLEKLRRTLRDQGEIKQEITSSTKEIKIGSYMIIGLIVFIYVMMNNALDGAIHHHFFSTANGKLQMLFIVLWVSLGLFVNSLLTKVKA
jgi:tight adherence protein B